MSFVERSGRSSWRVRYWRDDGTHGSLPGFPTKKAAEAKAREIDTERRRGEFIDPDAGTIALAEWTATWFEGLDLAPTTLAQYRSLAHTHILPRWGTTALGDITGTAVNVWANKLRARGYAASTVTTILKILTMILGDAADERLIPANPIRRQRRGRRHHDTVTEAVWVTPEQALRVALNAARLTTPDLGLLLITAAWTGARWGELTGLHRDNLHLHPNGTGCLIIDPRVGALHEVDRQLYLGPPKTAESARTIALPPFLVALLRQHLHTHPHDHVFTARDGAFLRRSNFARRAMRPAADGTTHHPRPPIAGRAGRPRADLPRAAAQPQNLAHRRRHPRRRPSPPPRPPHPRQDPTHLQPRRPRTRNPAARRPATALDHRPRRRQPVLDNPDPDQPDPGHTNLDELGLSELDALATPRLALPPSTGTTERAAS